MGGIGRRREIIGIRIGGNDAVAHQKRINAFTKTRDFIVTEVKIHTNGNPVAFGRKRTMGICKKIQGKGQQNRDGKSKKKKKRQRTD